MVNYCKLLTYQDQISDMYGILMYWYQLYKTTRSMKDGKGMDTQFINLEDSWVKADFMWVSLD